MKSPNRGWDFMNYNKTVDRVMALLVERNICTSSKKSHKDCYASLEQFMKQEGIEYCKDTRVKWLKKLKDELPR
jgi:hypothetical protein